MQVESRQLIQAVRFDFKDSDGIPAWYRQRADADGYPIVASGEVNPYALREAASLINLMLANRPDVRRAMIESGSRLCIIGWNEFTTDQPEFVRLARHPLREFAHNIHLRGLVNVDPTFDERLKKTMTQL